MSDTPPPVFLSFLHGMTTSSEQYIQCLLAITEITYDHSSAFLRECQSWAKVLA
jgi:hypothetical protein